MTHAVALSAWCTLALVSGAPQALALPAAGAEPPAVTLPYGALRGAWGVTPKAAAFRDVPYASAARFEVPSAPVPWTGIRDATQFGVGYASAVIARYCIAWLIACGMGCVF